MRISKTMFDEMIGPQGISFKDLEALVERPDQVDRFEFPSAGASGPVANIYVKVPPPVGPPFYLVALGFTVPSKSEDLVQAFRVPADWVRGDPRPLQVFEAVCQRCGFEFTIGEKRGHLILSERLEVPPGIIQLGSPPPGKLFEIVGGPRGGDEIIQHWFARNVDPTHIDVVYAYVLDMHRVRSLLFAR